MDTKEISTNNRLTGNEKVDLQLDLKDVEIIMQGLHELKAKISMPTIQNVDSQVRDSLNKENKNDKKDK